MSLLKICRVFFRVQRVDWDAFRSFLVAFDHVTFLKHLKKLSSPSKYVGIATEALLNAMEELQIDKTSGVLLRML